MLDRVYMWQVLEPVKVSAALLPSSWAFGASADGSTTAAPFAIVFMAPTQPMFVVRVGSLIVTGALVLLLLIVGIFGFWFDVKCGEARVAPGLTLFHVFNVFISFAVVAAMLALWLAPTDTIQDRAATALAKQVCVCRLRCKRGH